jgi:hypothetical protein
MPIVKTAGLKLAPPERWPGLVRRLRDEPEHNSLLKEYRAIGDRLGTDVAGHNQRRLVMVSDANKRGKQRRLEPNT